MIAIIHDEKNNKGTVVRLTKTTKIATKNKVVKFEIEEELVDYICEHKIKLIEEEIDEMDLSKELSEESINRIKKNKTNEDNIY